MDLDIMDCYDCEIIKLDREWVDMYMGYGWYEYAKDANLKAGDVLLCHYHSPSQTIYIRLWRRPRRNNA